jgi:hypothetical protein
MHNVCNVEDLQCMSELTCRFWDEISCSYEMGRIIRIISLSRLYVWCQWKLWISCPVMDGAPHRLSMPLMLFLFSPALTVSDILKNVPDRPTDRPTDYSHSTLWIVSCRITQWAGHRTNWVNWLKHISWYAKRYRCRQTSWTDVAHLVWLATCFD